MNYQKETEKQETNNEEVIEIEKKAKNTPKKNYPLLLCLKNFFSQKKQKPIKIVNIEQNNVLNHAMIQIDTNAAKNQQTQINNIPNNTNVYKVPSINFLPVKSENRKNLQQFQVRKSQLYSNIINIPQICQFQPQLNPSNNVLITDNQANESHLKLKNRNTGGRLSKVQYNKNKILNARSAKILPQMNFQGIKSLRKPQEDKFQLESNIDLIQNSSQQDSSVMQSNQDIQLNKLASVFQKNHKQIGQRSQNELFEGQDENFLNKLNYQCQDIVQKQKIKEPKRESQIEIGQFYHNCDIKQLKLKKKQNYIKTEIKQKVQISEEKKDDSDIISKFSIKNEPLIKNINQNEIKNVFVEDFDVFNQKKKKPATTTTIEKIPKQVQSTSQFKRCETKKVTKKIDMQLSKAKNQQEIEAFLFNPKYMKARILYNDINEIINHSGYDDILPKKKEKNRQQKKDMQRLKLKQIKFNLNYTQIKKKISKLKPQQKQNQKAIFPFNRNLNFIQLINDNRKFSRQHSQIIKNEIENESSQKNENVEIPTHQKSPIHSLRSGNNSIAFNKNNSNFYKSDTKNDNLKNSFVSKLQKANKKQQKLKNKINNDNPVQQWDVQKAKQLIFSFQKNNFEKIFQHEDSVFDNFKDDKKVHSFQSNFSISNFNINIAQQPANKNDLILNEYEQEQAKFAQEPIEKAYNNVRKQELFNAEKNFNYDIEVQWSIEEILEISQHNKSDNQFNLLLRSINSNQENINIYEGGIYGIIAAFRRIVKSFVLSAYFDNFIMLCVVMNTVVLALDGVLDAQGDIILTQFNFTFTIIFTVDMGLKLFGQGLFEYLADKMNIFDAAIVCLSLVELLILNGQGGNSSKFSAFRSIRILRVFRVLRVTRLIRSLQFMKIMMEAIANNISSFIYILLLLFLFIFIYALLGTFIIYQLFHICQLGMQAFGGNFTQIEAGRMNFDSFLNAFMSVFQVMTMENWNDIETTCLTSTVHPAICLSYLISWIFVGNYVLLNLLLAIVMDSFNDDEINEDKEEYLKGLQVEQDIAFNNQVDGTSVFNQTTMLLNQSGYQQISLKQISGSNLKNNVSVERSLKQSSLKNEKNDSDMKNKENQSNENSSKPKKEAAKDFVGIECQNAFFLFSQQNIVRIVCYRIVKHDKFETVILIAIMLTSLKLVLDTYIDDKSPDQELEIKISKQFDIIFTAFFTIESLLKAITFGFVMDKNSYLREAWSQLDFFIVISSLIDASVETIDLSVVKILRLLRTLRPLRFISHNRSMKLIVTALLESVGGIVNVVIVLLLIWLMFAILAINLMKGKLNYCNLPLDYPSNANSLYTIHETECDKIQGAKWQAYDINFDNIGSGMLTLFVLSTLEGWPNYLLYFIDSDDDGPVKNNNMYFVVYFVVFIFIGSLFLLNLFVAIMSFNYNLASKKSKNQYLTDGQAQWIELQRLLVKSTPDYASLKPPENKYRKYVWRFCESVYLDTFIMTCIILNIVTMAMTYENSKPKFDLVVNDINFFFTASFICEAILKIIAYGIRGYFHKGWNQFDFFVVCTSILDIIMNLLGNSFISFLKSGPQIARVFRVLRVTRLFRLVKSFQNLQKLIQTAVYSLPSLLNVASLLFLVYFIFAILAVFLFGSVKKGVYINDYYNFSNFHSSIYVLFICSTGENWYLYMFDLMHHGSSLTSIFFLFFIVIVQFVMMNLFILIIIDQFEQNYINQDNPLNEFQEFEDNFKAVWVIHTKKTHGVKINERFLTDFYFELKGPQGFDYQDKKQKFIDKVKENNRDIKHEELQFKLEKFKVQMKQIAAKDVMQMNILCDYEEGYVYFNDLMFFIQKFALYDIINDVQNQAMALKQEQVDKFQKALELIRKEEKNTFKKLVILKKKQNLIKQQKLSNHKVAGVNPVVRRLFVGMAFKSWRKYSAQMQLKLQNSEYKNDDISSHSETDDENLNNEPQTQEQLQLDYNHEEEDRLLNLKSDKKPIKRHIIKRQHTFKIRELNNQNYIRSYNNLFNQQFIYLPDTQIYKDEFFDFCLDNEYYNNKIKYISQLKKNKSPFSSQQCIENQLNNSSQNIQNNENLNSPQDSKIQLPCSYINANQKKSEKNKSELSLQIPIYNHQKIEQNSHQQSRIIYQ